MQNGPTDHEIMHTLSLCILLYIIIHFGWGFRYIHGDFKVIYSQEGVGIKAR
jgi:hypothetical protein